MNKVDLLVKRMMIEFPTLYPNRFEALAEVFTNSCFEWNDDGTIAEIFRLKDLPPETMVVKYEQELAQWKEKAEKDEDWAKQYNYKYIAEAEVKLMLAKHRAANIDIYASEYTNVHYDTIVLWLFGARPSKYWLVNNKPEVVDEEWRLAIRDWFSQMMPVVNGAFGQHHKDENCKAF